MKPTSPLQLARLLDQVGGSYPHGIPVRSIVSTAPSSTPEVAAPLYQFLVVGEGELSPVASALFEGITSKGLRLSSDEYTLSFIREEDISAELAKRESARVIVFGASADRGLMDRSGGEPALLAHSLEEISANTEIKKELWRGLQAFLARP
jgi:hypothetical protein